MVARVAALLALLSLAMPAMAQTYVAARGLAVQARTLANSTASLRERRGPVAAIGIGDSLTYGNNANNTRSQGALSYLAQVQLRSGGRIVVRRNIGIPGNKSGDIVIRLSDEALSVPDADVAFVLEGTNDLAQAVPTATLARNDRLIIRALRSRGVRAVMIAIPPNDANGAGSISYNAVKQGVALAEGAIWIDPWATARATGGTYVTGASTDGVHPTQAYTALAAQAILADPQIAALLPLYPAAAPLTNGDLTAPGLNGDFTGTYTSGSNVIPSNWSLGGNTTSAVGTDPVTGFGVVTLIPTSTAATTVLAANDLDVSPLAGRRVAISGKISTTGLASSGGSLTVRLAAGNSEALETDFQADPIYQLSTDVTDGAFYQEMNLPAGLSRMKISVFFSGLTSVAGLSVSLREVSIRQTTLQGLDSRTRRQPERIRSVAANATLTIDDQIVLVDATAGNVTLTLPKAGQGLYDFGAYSASYQRLLPGTGLRILLVRTDASANTVTVQRASTDTIEGATSFTIAGQYTKAAVTGVKNGLWIKQ